MASCPPGESCWISHPLGGALGRCHVAYSHLSRTMAQLMPSLWQQWAASPQLPGCDPASLRQPISPSRAECIRSARSCLLCSGLTSSLASPWHNAVQPGTERHPPHFAGTHFPVLTCRPGLRGSPDLTCPAARLPSLPIFSRAVQFPIPLARATQLLQRRCWFNAAAQLGASPVTTHYLG